jgi:hypothetical protein
MRGLGNRAAGVEQPTVQREMVSGAIFLLLLSSVFQAAAVFSIRTRQGFTAGVAAYWLIVPMSLVMAFRQLRSAKTSVGGEVPRDTRVASMCLLAFAAYGIFSALVLPFVFHGTKVLDPRLGMNSQYLNPSTLKWSLSNAGQAGYMLLNCLVFLFLAATANNTKTFARAHDALVGTAFLVLGFAVFQHISVLYAPNGIYRVAYALTHNNLAAYSYPVTDPRTTSFFLEPSFFAGYAATMSVVGLNAYLYAGRKSSLRGLSLPGAFSPRNSPERHRPPTLTG